MEKTILWLKEIEATASVVYEKAALRFSHDKALSDLLLKLSQDERSHEKTLERALEATAAHVGLTPALTMEFALDERTKQDILKPFIELRNRLSNNRLSKEELLNCVIEIEFSELNHVFLYLINSAAERSGSHLKITSDVEDHKDGILEYLASTPDRAELMKKAGRLPKALKRKILVVDDKAPNTALLKAILDGEGSVDTALSAREALDKVASKPFSAVITDVDMPEMSGIDFYKKTIEKHPELKDRFIFYTGSEESDCLSFFRENKLPYLLKPASINSIRSTVRSILHLK